MCQNSDWTSKTCWSPMVLHCHFGLQWGMSVSDGACWSPMGHVGLRWDMLVSDGICWSPMGRVGLRSGMSVSEGVCRGLQ